MISWPLWRSQDIIVKSPQLLLWLLAFLSSCQNAHLQAIFLIISTLWKKKKTNKIIIIIWSIFFYLFFFLSPLSHFVLTPSKLTFFIYDPPIYCHLVSCWCHSFCFYFFISIFLFSFLLYIFPTVFMEFIWLHSYI